MSEDEYVWVPTRLLSLRWKLLADWEEPKACRRRLSGAGYVVCRRPSVARLWRPRYPKTGTWWHYCEQHLYGREIHDGVLMSQVHRDSTVVQLHLKGAVR